MSPPVFVLLLVLPLDLSVRSLYVVVNQGLLKSFDELFSLTELFSTLGPSLSLLLLLLDLLFDVDPLLESGQAIISGEGIDDLDGINRSDTSNTHCIVRAHKEGHLDQVLPRETQIPLNDIHIILFHELISVKDVAVDFARAEKQGIRVFSDDTIDQAYGFQISALAFRLERSFHIGYPAELQQSLKFLEILFREKGEGLGRPFQLLNEHDVLFKYFALHLFKVDILELCCEGIFFNLFFLALRDAVIEVLEVNLDPRQLLRLPFLDLALIWFMYLCLLVLLRFL